MKKFSEKCFGSLIAVSALCAASVSWSAERAPEFDIEAYKSELRRMSGGKLAGELAAEHGKQAAACVGGGLAVVVSAVADTIPLVSLGSYGFAYFNDEVEMKARLKKVTGREEGNGQLLAGGALNAVFGTVAAAFKGLRGDEWGDDYYNGVRQSYSPTQVTANKYFKKGGGCDKATDKTNAVYAELDRRNKSEVNPSAVAQGMTKGGFQLPADATATTSEQLLVRSGMAR